MTATYPSDFHRVVALVESRLLHLNQIVIILNFLFKRYRLTCCNQTDCLVLISAPIVRDIPSESVLCLGLNSRNGSSRVSSLVPAAIVSSSAACTISCYSLRSQQLTLANFLQKFYTEFLRENLLLATLGPFLIESSAPRWQILHSSLDPSG